MSNPERVRLTVSLGCCVLAALLSVEPPVLAGLAPSVRRVPAVSVGLKPWPLIRSVIRNISGVETPVRAYRPLQRQL
jgi:hypothetical protein